MNAPALFAGRDLRGRDWLRHIPADDRRVWAELGRITLAEMDINWHSLGGKARSADCRRDKRGRFARKEQ